MGASFGIQTLVGNAQPLNRNAGDEVLGNNDCGIAGLHIAVPDCLRIDHHNRPMLTLIQTTGFVDAHFAGQAGRFGQLLQLEVQIALAIDRARDAGSSRWTGVVANKNMVFECGQTGVLRSECRFRRLPSRICRRTPGLRSKPGLLPEKRPKSAPRCVFVIFSSFRKRTQKDLRDARKFPFWHCTRPPRSERMEA